MIMEIGKDNKGECPLRIEVFETKVIPYSWAHSFFLPASSRPLLGRLGQKRCSQSRVARQWRHQSPRPPRSQPPWRPLAGKREAVSEREPIWSADFGRVPAPGATPLTPPGNSSHFPSPETLPGERNAERKERSRVPGIQSDTGINSTDIQSD